MGIDNRGEPVLDVRTITLEARELEDDDDRVVRKSLRAASAQALRDIATQVTHPQFSPPLHKHVFYARLILTTISF